MGRPDALVVCDLQILCDFWLVAADVWEEASNAEGKGKRTGRLTLAAEFNERSAFCGAQDGRGSHGLGRWVDCYIEEARERKAGGRYVVSGKLVTVNCNAGFNATSKGRGRRDAAFGESYADTERYYQSVLSK